MSLETIHERAEFLLNIGVTATIQINNLTPVYQSQVGGLLLPPTANTKEDAIRKGTKWLKNKASNTSSDEGA